MSSSNMISTDTVHAAIDQVFGILSKLQGQLDSGNNKTISTADTNERLDMQQYQLKCNELNAMTRKYNSKCHEYEQLLTKYNSLQALKSSNTNASGRYRNGSGARNTSPVKLATFEDLEELGQAMSAPGCIRAKKRAAPVASTSPTKRVKNEHAPNISYLVNVIASPVAVDRQSGQRRLEKQAAKPDVLGSSQETRMDFSDLCLPVEAEELIELCPASDVEDEAKAESSGKGGGDALKRILEAVGDCAECRAFYSVPGLVLPKRDPSGLCGHRGKKKGRVSYPDTTARKASPKAQQQKHEQQPRQRKSEGGWERQSTPDNFWDIDFFPPIRTASPEARLLRKDTLK
ncbi:hypothetical protein GGI07_004423 [Coemansia sp. Benny D115]|nr:hypothetical protein GGI07_004423 [Coemansia sp. Benny D115]